VTQVASRDRPLEQGREQSDARNDDDGDKKDKPRGIRKVCIEIPPFRLQMTSLTRIHLVLFFCILAGTEHVTCSSLYTQAFQDLPPVISSSEPLQAPTVWSICSVHDFTDPNLPRLQAYTRPVWPNFAVHSIKAHSFQFAVDVLSCHSSLSDGPLMVPSW